MKTFAFLSHLDFNLYLFRTPIIKELILRGYKVYAICPLGSKNQALRDIGCEVVNYDIDRKSLNPLSEKKSIDNIYDAIKDLKIDILHTFTAKPNIYGTLAAKKAGIPIIINLVEGLGSFYVHNSLKNIMIRTIIESLYKKVFRLSNGCVFVNTSDPKYMIEKKIINEEKVKVIKSVGVDTEVFSMKHYTKDKLLDIRKKLELENKIVVLMVSRAIWDKGIREYYEAANILKNKYDNIEFLFVGGTDEGNHSCANENFLNNGKVKWLGQRNDIVNVTAISDIYVLPSYKEGLPATLMEASAMEKPMVTTDTVGCRDVVDDGVNGFLVPVKDATKLAQKIEILLNDKTLRETMGKKAKEKALQEYDVKKVVKQYMEYYETFI